MVEIVPGRVLAASIRDVSRTGLRLELHQAIERGVNVKVVLPRDVVVFGQVRYSKPAGDRFHIGIQIDTMQLPEEQAAKQVQAKRIAPNR